MEIKKMKYTKDQQEVVEMTDKDCIFCKIAGGNIPSSTVYEDEQFRVILDLSPATKGHALILPKQHYANIFEIDEKLEAFSTDIHSRLIPDFLDYGVQLKRFYVTTIVKPDGDPQYEKFKELHFRQYADIAEAKQIMIDELNNAE